MSTIVNILVILRDMDMISEQKIFKIDQSIDQDNFSVHAGECARHIIYHI